MSARRRESRLTLRESRSLRERVLRLERMLARLFELHAYEYEGDEMREMRRQFEALRRGL